MKLMTGWNRWHEGIAMHCLAFVRVFGFALLLPFSLAAEFVMNRKDLHSARTKSKIGWLYSRFVKGAEFWEVHEIMRKMLLTTAVRNG